MAVVEVRHGYPDDFGSSYEAIPRSYPETDWNYWRRGQRFDDEGVTFPHCDSEVLHAPGECAVCDLYPGRQQARVNGRVAFSGHDPVPGQDPCPADERRPKDSVSWHGHWGGNAQLGGPVPSTAVQHVMSGARVTLPSPEKPSRLWAWLERRVLARLRGTR